MGLKKIIFISISVFFLSQILPASGPPGGSKTEFDLKIDVRSYFSNDQRIQWSGAEATFGTEAIIRGNAKKMIRNTEFFAGGEIRLNQSFDNNFLVDEYREKYIQNFKTDRFQIAGMFVGLRVKNFELSLGKRRSIFGNDQLVHLTNGEIFQPFIRTESVLWWETGLFLKYRKGIIRLDLSVVNGGPDKDTNSSKAAVARAGIELKNFAIGVSAKVQDGIGSEQQKQYKNHIGFDISFRSGKFRLSAEGIYDEYGFRKEFNSDDIFWERSLYYRDQFYKSETPITGIGGYIDLSYHNNKILVNINYGEFHPEKINNPYHDPPIRRGILKFIYNFSHGFGIFLSTLIENDRLREPVFSGAEGYAYIVGMTFSIN